MAIFTASWYGIVHFCPLSEAIPGGSGFAKRAGARFGRYVARIIGQNPLLDSRFWKSLKRIPLALGAFGASRHELHLSALYTYRGGNIMRRSVVWAVIVLAVLALSSSVSAATVDIVNYSALKPGKWSIFQESGGTSKQGFITVAGASGQIVRKYYNNEGAGWTFDSSTVFKVTSTSFQIIGMNDGKDMWIFEPACTFPRLLTVNQSYHRSIIMRNKRTNATQFTVICICVTQKGITVHTAPGTFSNCIKIRKYEYSPGVMRMTTELYAPGREKLKSWVSKIKDTTNPEKETQSSFTKELIQFGDSDPPIP
ncbi:hypothetical protein [Syntrophobacter fumaroxidans]|nr:hypothetical protein [Syntrophobacter fumaroxidans]